MALERAREKMGLSGRLVKRHAPLAFAVRGAYRIGLGSFCRVVTPEEFLR
jgi:hypothetical protein